MNQQDLIKKCKIKMIVDSRERSWENIRSVWQAKGIDYYIKDKGKNNVIFYDEIAMTLPT